MGDQDRRRLRRGSEQFDPGRGGAVDHDQVGRSVADTHAGRSGSDPTTQVGQTDCVEPSGDELLG